MPTTTIERAPEVSCYRCGRTDIYSVCHHCAKPMCKEHSNDALRASGKPPQDPGTSGKPASAEYGGLKLENPQAAVYHCEDHDHTVSGPGGFLVIGAIVAIVGIIVLLLSPVPGIVILLAGPAVAGYGVYKMQRDRGGAAVKAPDLPLFPHVRSARVIERLEGTVDLQGAAGQKDGAGGQDNAGSKEGRYHSTAGDVTGTVVFSMTHSDWQERLRQYRKKYRIAESVPVRFNAGFAMLQGQAGLAFADAQPLVLDTRTGLWFRGSAPDHDLFAAVEGRQEGEWNPTVTYQLQEGRKPNSIPLWIVPSLVPASDQRTLEIDLHWTPLSGGDAPEGDTLLSDRRGPAIGPFDRIQLKVPADWGNMENAAPGGALTTAPQEGQDFRIIEWQQVPPHDPDHEYLQLQERRSRQLTIRFEEPIPPESTLSGRIEATFEGTLSGVTGVGLYLPGGRKSDRQWTSSAKTKVAVDFTVSLGAIRYQDDRVVPDENNQGDRDKERSKPAEFAGVVPNSDVIIKLTNAISRDDYYVKSVLEHSPYRDDSRAGVLTHVWDISGRFYTRVFPIDFDIHVRGEENQGALGSSAGKTAVQVTVKGSYATGGNADGSLRESIEKKWDDLHARVARVFGDALRAAEADNALGQPAAIGAGQVFEPPAPERATAEPVVIGEPEIVEPRATGRAEVVDSVVLASPAGPEAHDKAERKADLMRQWKVADEAVMTGRITGDVYQAIITRIKSELRDLGEDLGE